jgi:hypothetical protein
LNPSQCGFHLTQQAGGISPNAKPLVRWAVYAPEAAALASSRSAAIRFCKVRRLIPNISAASLRLPRTCSSVILM